MNIDYFEPTTQLVGSKRTDRQELRKEYTFVPKVWTLREVCLYHESVMYCSGSLIMLRRHKTGTGTSALHMGMQQTLC